MARETASVGCIAKIDHEVVEQTVVGGENPKVPLGKSEGSEYSVGRSLQRAAGEQRTHPDDSRCGAYRVGYPRNGEDGPDRKGRIGWSDDDEIRLADRFEDAWCR